MVNRNDLFPYSHSVVCSVYFTCSMREWYEQWGPGWTWDFDDKFIAPHNLKVDGWEVIPLDKDPSYLEMAHYLRNGMIPFPKSRHIPDFDYDTWRGLVHILKYKPLSELVKHHFQDGTGLTDKQFIQIFLEWGVTKDSEFYGFMFWDDMDFFLDGLEIKPLNEFTVQNQTFDPDPNYLIINPYL